MWDLKFSLEWKCGLSYPGMCCHANPKSRGKSFLWNTVTIFILCCLTPQKSVILTDLVLCVQFHVCWNTFMLGVNVMIFWGGLRVFSKVPYSLNIIILQFFLDSIAQDLQTKWHCIIMLHIHCNYIYTEHNYFVHKYMWCDLISVLLVHSGKEKGNLWN